MPDRQALRDWLARYEAAWRTNDAATVRALFTEDATYRWHPYDGEEPAHGADAITRAWLEEPDDPNSWELYCEPLAIDGDLGVRCRTTYYAKAGEPQKLYHNIFLVRLTDDGRCSDFTEYYMKEPPKSS